MKTSSTYPQIRDTENFAVNILSREQEARSSQFARKGTDKWVNVQWAPSGEGNPVLDGTLAWLDCRIWTEHDAGDHIIVLGQVLELGATDAHLAEPLLYFEGQYRALRPSSNS